MGIQWSNIVGNNTVENGGYVGDLMAIARAHIEDAVRSNEITQAEAGQVYTAMIPAAFSSGIQFEMQNELNSSQLANSKIDAALKLETVPANIKDRILETIDTIVEPAQDEVVI